MNSINKMREFIKERFVINSQSLNSGMQIADEIEAEIAVGYMRLPCDADGVPIHIGDEIQYVNEQDGTGAKVKICAIADSYVYYSKGRIHGYPPESCRHIKPRTLEDVLNDRINDVLRVMTSGIPIALETALNDSFGEECVDEIRELLGGDAE